MATDANLITELTQDKPPRPKRWIPLSLRIFVALMAIIAAVAAWEGQRIYRRHLAIRQIERLGGNIGRAMRGPRWIYDRIGHHWATAVIGIKYIDFMDARLSGHSEHDVDDAELESLIQIASDVEELWLGNTEIGDSGIGQLRRNKQLRILFLSSTKVTDTGVEQLNDLAHLAKLDLSFTGVTDVGVRHLRELKQLNYLGLSGTEVTDAGLAHLSGLTNLRHLDLYRSAVTDEGIEELRKALPRCEITR